MIDVDRDGRAGARETLAPGQSLTIDAVRLARRRIAPSRRFTVIEP